MAMYERKIKRMRFHTKLLGMAAKTEHELVYMYAKTICSLENSIDYATLSEKDSDNIKDCIKASISIVNERRKHHEESRKNAEKA